MQTNKNSTGVFIFLVIAISTLALLTAIGGSNQRTLAGPKQDDATPCQEGMTDSQREHSKLYKAFASRRNLRSLAESSATDIEIVNGIPQQAFTSEAPPFNLQDFLRDMARESDAVVIGIVSKKASFFTEDETFVFSDYDLNVEEVLKNNHSHPIKLTSLTVTRPGGTVMVGRRAVRAVDESLEPLAVGERYLLFLEFIPRTGAYKAFNSKGSFQLEGNNTLKLTRENLPYELESGTKASLLISTIRNVAGQS